MRESLTIENSMLNCKLECLSVPLMLIEPYAHVLSAKDLASSPRGFLRNRLST